MGYPIVEKRLLPEGGPYAPTGAGQTILGTVGDAQGQGERVIGAACRVKVAGTTTAAVSLGKTGAVTAFMTAADVAATVAGRKQVASGADLAGNGTQYTAKTNVVADYVAGAVHPVIRFVLLVVPGDSWDDILDDVG
jgi:hypothetical protein